MTWYKDGMLLSVDTHVMNTHKHTVTGTGSLLHVAHFSTDDEGVYECMDEYQDQIMNAVRLKSGNIVRSSLQYLTEQNFSEQNFRQQPEFLSLLSNYRLTFVFAYWKIALLEVKFSQTKVLSPI